MLGTAARVRIFGFFTGRYEQSAVLCHCEFERLFVTESTEEDLYDDLFLELSARTYNPIEDDEAILVTASCVSNPPLPMEALVRFDDDIVARAVDIRPMKSLQYKILDVGTCPMKENVYE